MNCIIAEREKQKPAVSRQGELSLVRKRAAEEGQGVVGWGLRFGWNEDRRPFWWR